MSACGERGLGCAALLGCGLACWVGPRAGAQRSGEREWDGLRGKGSWETRAKSQGEVCVFLFYFVFKTKFNYEPNANANIVSNILFNSNKMSNFGRLPKINFTPF